MSWKLSQASLPPSLSSDCPPSLPQTNLSRTHIDPLLSWILVGFMLHIVTYTCAVPGVLYMSQGGPGCSTLERNQQATIIHY